MTSILSTVTGALGYENLGGGYKQPTSRITSVPSRDGNGVRQAMGLPNGIVPGVQNPIPTSTARPGKQTNQRVVYTRVQNQFHKECGSVARVPVMEGDVVFVFRQDGTNTAGLNSGHDVSRTSRIASILQLNKMLESGRVDGEITMPARPIIGVDGAGNPRYGPPLDPRGVEPPADSLNPVWDRWVHCRTLARWTPDGVLASKEHDCVMDASNPGEAYNVTIGGPTLMRNAAHGEFPQHFDDGVRTLDKVFVGLIATEHRAYDQANDVYGEVEYFSYSYKLFTSRQLMWAPLGQQSIRLKDMERNAPGGINTLGPTVDEYARMVQVWRVGSVLDSKAGMMPHKCAMLNVVIEPWSLKMMQMEYNPYFGESLALTPIDGRAVLDLLRLCEQFVQQEGASIVQALESLGPLYRTTFADEVAHWEAADAEWRDNVSLAGLRGRTPADYPPPEVGSSATRGGHHGPQLGGRSYYADGSDELKAFYALFRNGLAWCARCRLLFTTAIAELALVGRAVALNSQTKLMEWVEAQGRTAVIVEAQKLHVTVMALRPIMRVGEQIAAGRAQAVNRGGRWPVQ